MQYKTVNDMEMPSIGLGTWEMDGEECVSAVKHALENGYRHIDTAHMYGNEEAVGRGVTEANIDRDDVFLTTKVWYTDLERDAVYETVEESLDRLDTAYVDLVLVHWPNPDIPLEETLSAFQDVQEEGMTRYIGVSNFTTDLLKEAQGIAPEIAVNQVEMHPYLQQQGLREYCQDQDVLLTAYRPLGKGNVLTDETLHRIGEKHGKSSAQVALRWLVEQENVAAIPKSASPQHRAENLDIFDFALDDEDRQRIASLAAGQRFVDEDWAPWNW